MKKQKLKLFMITLTVLALSFITVGAYTTLNKKLVLVVDGSNKQISTFKSNVEELLIEQNVKLNSKDMVSVDLDSKLKDNMNIKITRVKESKITETQSIPYEVKIEKDNELNKGKTVVKQEGKEGQRDLVYKLVYHDGKNIDKQLVKEYISMDPVDKIIKEGTKEKVVQVVSRGNVNRSSSRTNATNVSTKSEYSKQISVTATAYTGGGTTSTGTKARWGVIAVDPSVIPYGTRVYIPKLKQTFVAQDTGSAIKGNKIDIYMDSKSQAINWGVKNITLYILK
jgi:3D (Asp-Asp-Asp) domain-containing protein